MARNVNQTRMTQLIELLRYAPSTMVTITKKYNISSRTVYRYINYIESTGYMVHKDELGRFSIKDNGTSTLTSLTYDEIDRLCQMASKNIYTTSDRVLYSKLCWIRKNSKPCPLR